MKRLNNKAARILFVGGHIGVSANNDAQDFRNAA